MVIGFAFYQILDTILGFCIFIQVKLSAYLDCLVKVWPEWICLYLLYSYTWLFRFQTNKTKSNISYNNPFFFIYGDTLMEFRNQNVHKIWWIWVKCQLQTNMYSAQAWECFASMEYIYEILVFYYILSSSWFFSFTSICICIYVIWLILKMCHICGHCTNCKLFWVCLIWTVWLLQTTVLLRIWFQECNTLGGSEVGT